jgi:electron transport complex protein RnfE
VFKENPVFVTGLALPFCIVPSTSLQNGLVMSIMIFAATLPPVAIAVGFGRFIHDNLKLPVYSLVSMGFVLWISNWFQLNYPLTVASIGIYLPLAAVNTIMVEMCYRSSIRTTRQRVSAVLRHCFGFAIAVCIISSFREVIAFNTLYNKTLNVQFVRYNAFALPFFGFLLIGFLSAFLKKLNRLFGKKIKSGGLEKVGFEHEF